MLLVLATCWPSCGIRKHMHLTDPTAKRFASAVSIGFTAEQPQGWVVAVGWGLP